MADTCAWLVERNNRQAITKTATCKILDRECVNIRPASLADLWVLWVAAKQMIEIYKRMSVLFTKTKFPFNGVAAVKVGHRLAIL